MKAVLVFLLAITITLLGCKTEVGRIAVGESRIEEQTVSCTYSGMCFTCMPGGIGFDGRLNNTCGFKLSSMCSGTQLIRAKVTPTEIQYDDGSTRQTEITEEIEELSGCH